MLDKGLGYVLSGVVLALLTNLAQAEDTVESAVPFVAAGTQIAFLPDIHFHDVYATFADEAFVGVREGGEGSFAVLRTMQAQLHSTRLFNENYFALLAALDDLAEQGVTLVALPGDFSDDGQPIHLRGLQKLLRHYEATHGMRFFAIPGNHDPVRPYDRDSGKSDFLGADGQAVPIYSHHHPHCAQMSLAGLICSDELIELGYVGIFDYMGEFGMTPRAEDLYWETPFSNFSYQGYDRDSANQAAELSSRQYRVCRERAPRNQADEQVLTNCAAITDASYLVEPVDGLWLLAIDANIYQPVAEHGAAMDDADSFHGAGNAGYNMLLTHKPHVIAWITDVVKRADAQGKQLIAFSHYPMVEFYAGMSPHISQLFGSQSFQIGRVPSRNVSQALADTGLQLHVAGHMHFNHTSVVEGRGGNQLVNIQAPSIAGYKPAYKILTLLEPDVVEVTTPVLQDVEGFDRFFPLYQRELASASAQPGWRAEILQSESYTEFTEWHLHELARQRFLPHEWPAVLREEILQASGAELAVMLGGGSVHSALISAAWDWQGLELATDFYRLRNAGSLGLADIEPLRLKQYSQLQQIAASSDSKLGLQLSQLMIIFEGFKKNSLVSDEFIIDTKTKPACAENAGTAFKNKLVIRATSKSSEEQHPR